MRKSDHQIVYNNFNDEHIWCDKILSNNND